MADALDRVGALSPGQALDTTRLTNWLHAHLDFTGPLGIQQFHGGASNPTYFLTEQGSGARYVLRKQPSGVLAASAHAVDREYRVMAALEPTAVPVPPMLGWCDDTDVIGTPFYVMPFLEGRIYTDNGFTGMDAADRREAYRDIARTLAALHAVDPATVGLSDYGRPGDFYQRQIARWTRQYRAAETGRIDSMEALIEELPRRAPPAAGDRIVHGDFRQENLMFAPGAPRVIAVLDWELSTLGDPLADLAFFCLFYHADFMPWARGIVPGLDGVPTEAEFVADYRAAAGRGPITDWPFYLAFAAFRLAAIAQGVTKRIAEGRFQSRARVGADAWADLASKLATEDYA